MTIIEEIKAKLPKLKTNDYLRYLNIVEKKVNLRKLSSLKIAILRSYTVEPLEPLLKLRLILEGFNPKFLYGGYSQFAQEAFDNSSFLYSYKPDIILFLARLEDLLPNFFSDFDSMSFFEWKQAIKSLVKQLGTYARNIRRKLKSQIIFQNMSFGSLPYWGVFDAQQIENQVSLVHNLNQLLIKEMNHIPDAFIWDFNHFLLRKGFDFVYDPKMWYLSKNPFRHSAYPEIIADLCKYIISAIGKVKKCIVLDLDNTLWGGIIGEDGMAGIALGQDYPGICYVDFQRKLLNLFHRGILLAINSKNNEEDAFEVIDNHPDMVLRRKHFASYQINWNDKATNLMAIAKVLNIGIDSFIFIDDNPVECEFIRQQFLECTVVRLPDKPYLIPIVASYLPGIENIRLTAEDQKKGEFYQAQLERKKFENLSGDIGEFLESLEMEMEIKPACDFTIPRISQLTQKTNQLNMTTRRYSEADIIEFASSSDCDVFSVSSRDRFGENGIVGVIILKFVRQTCYIDTFLLSCRVIGRTIEQSMVAFIVEFAKARGIYELIGEFIPTKKNKPAGDIYASQNFRKIDENRFVADLRDQKFEYSPYIKHSIKT